MFKLPMILYNKVLHAFSCKMIAQEPTKIDELMAKILKWAERECANCPENSMYLTAALYLSALHIIETGVTNQTDTAPDEIKRAMALLSLASVSSADTSGERH